MKKNVKVTLSLFTLLIVSVLIAEILMRQFVGLGKMPLYKSSDIYEYIVQPNQSGHRFGCRYYYNSFSQRCDEPDSSKVKVLGLGDSVLFGGATIDQDDIATTIYTNETGIQMLNISAGSWGPDNCAAYLKHHGLFDAKAIFLLVSSHDATDNMDFTPVVGKSVHNPDKQYTSAWHELFARYLIPRLKFKNAVTPKDPDQQIADRDYIVKAGKTFNTGFAQIKEIADSASLPLFVCLHAEKKELEEGYYNEMGNDIIGWCNDNGVFLIKLLDEGLLADMYRDNIHLNEKGLRFLADIMKKYIVF